MDLPPFEPKNTPAEPEAARPDRPRDVVVPKKIVVAGAAAVLFLFLLFSGLLSRGYESKTIRFSGISRSSQGSGFGSKRVFLRKGQTFTVRYEAEIERGGLHVRVRPYWASPRAPATREVRLRQSGSGELRVPVPDTGVYEVWIRGLPDRDGYDVSYTVSWKTQR